MAFVMMFLTDFKASLLTWVVLEETEGDEPGNESAGEEQVERIEQSLAMVGYESPRSQPVTPKIQVWYSQRYNYSNLYLYLCYLQTKYCRFTCTCDIP
jgi:hypothetical protein